MYDLVAYHIWPEYRTIYYINVTLIDSNQQILWGNPSFSKGTFPGYPIAPSGSERVRVTFQVCCQPTLFCKKWETVSSVHASLLVWYISNVKDLRVEALSAWKCESSSSFLFSVVLSLPSQWDQTSRPPCKWWFPLLMSSLCSSPSSSKLAFAIRLAPWSTYPALLDELHWNQMSYPVVQHVVIFLRISFEARLDAILPCCLSHPPLSKSLIILISIQMSFRFCQHIPACFILRALSGMVAGLGRGEELSK